MFQGIFSLLYDIVAELATETTNLISYIFGDFFKGNNDLGGMEFNLSLFSETPIFTTTVYDFLLLFFTIFYIMFFIILLYKVSKKVIKSVFGVLKWW